MYYLLSLPLSVVGAGLFLTIRAACCAPEGYEDDDGFHFAPSASADSTSLNIK